MKKIILNHGRVGELGMWADAVTGVTGWFGYAYDPGDGTRYVSGRDQRSWHGPRANHLCASYLFGVIQASARGRALLADPQHWLTETKEATDLNPREFNSGQADAESAIRWARERGGRDLRAVREAGA